MWGGHTFIYNNPFYVVRPVVSTTIIETPVWLDYSEPLQAPTDEVIESLGDETEAPLDPDMEQATKLFDEARDAFAASDYKRALELVDEAIRLMPYDATLHEFRALCLFALADYQQAAATVYAVLAAGPGWNWETLASFYQDTSNHTAQLRALEAHVGANPEDAAAAFLLGYHYMTMGYLEEAVSQWEQVGKLLPDDQLVSQLLEAFGQRPQDAVDTTGPNTR